MTTSITVAAASSGNNTLVAAPGANKYIRVMGILLVGTGTVNGYLRSGTGGTFHVGNSTTPVPFAVNTGFCLQDTAGMWFDCDTNEALVLNLSGAVGLAGTLKYEIRTVA